MNNILIPFANSIDPMSGGVERVYHNIVPFFISHGYKVYATYHIKSAYDTKAVYTQIHHINIPISDPNYYTIMDGVIDRFNINIVIYPFVDHELINYFSRKKELKVFFHIHNVPSALLCPTISNLPSFLKGTYIDTITKYIRKIVRYNKAFKQIDQNGMKIVLLSNHFRKDLLKIYKFNSNNIKALPNPIISSQKDFFYKEENKENTILYVGKIITKQKRFYSLLNIWSKLQDKLPDYKLEILGGGAELSYYKEKAQKMGLQRLKFHGVKKPDEFYQKAKILCMTSTYEGFGMVLIEAMQYGCVPFAFNSFSALQDIINNNVNGFSIKPFDENEYADKIINFLSLPPTERQTISENAIRKSQEFNANIIGEKWIELFENY